MSIFPRLWIFILYKEHTETHAQNLEQQVKTKASWRNKSIYNQCTPNCLNVDDLKTNTSNKWSSFCVICLKEHPWKLKKNQHIQHVYLIKGTYRQKSNRKLIKDFDYYNYTGGFTLKHIPDMIKTYKQMLHANKYSQHSSIIWPVWLSGWVFVYKQGNCGIQSHCSHLIFKYGAFFKQKVPWHSGIYKTWIH